jgi:pimeloyl-ACP methyl ester carboxylesterase
MKPPPASRAGSKVVLVPGLWMPGAAMRLLAARLARAGYEARIFSYPGRSPLEANVEQLARFAAGTPVHFIGHSLGGLVIVEMLHRHSQVDALSVQLLGAPVRGCFAGRRFGRSLAGRWMMGASRALWEEREARWRRATPLGVIAGTLALGLGRAFGPLPGENDGVVCVSETTVDGMAARALVPEGHSMLIVSRQVGRLVERFLASASFE